MCGIAGIIDLRGQSVSEPAIRNMMKVMKHRGPDDEGVFMHGSVGFGFVRLSIIDLSLAGHQPMASANGRYTIVFNGELFNYIELRRKLQSLGVVFRTGTDTEVVLNAYITWGEKCLHEFNGMWAFAIYDNVSGSVFASRDRYGVKPFYYYKDEEQLIFASEIQGILKVLDKKRQPNQGAIFDFLIFNRTDQNEETFFKGIFKLKHGGCLTVIDNKIEIKNWYTLKESLKTPFQTANEYMEMLNDSVKLQMRSDVPVGICFSGGLDSSSILSLLNKKQQQHDIATFSAVYAKNEFGDESEYINLYKDDVKNMYFVSPSAQSLFDDMHAFVRAHGEPIPSTSPYAQFRVMGLAKGKVKVTVDGQGADEQLGGYHYFFGLYFKELFLKWKWFTLVKENIAYLKNHKSTYAFKTFVFFVLPPNIRTKLRAKENNYLHKSYYLTYRSSSRTADTLYSSRSLSQALLDHFEYKLEHLLKWEDRNSMHFSIEARVPFLDYRLVEKTISLPADKILKNGTTKSILREGMKGILPEKIRSRQDKIGFGTPEAEWFREPFFEAFVTDLLNSQSFKARKIIDHEKALKLYNSHLKKDINVSQEIWKWINLELWFREFID